MRLIDYRLSSNAAIPYQASALLLLELINAGLKFGKVCFRSSVADDWVFHCLSWLVVKILSGCSLSALLKSTHRANLLFTIFNSLIMSVIKNHQLSQVSPFRELTYRQVISDLPLSGIEGFRFA